MADFLGVQNICRHHPVIKISLWYWFSGSGFSSSVSMEGWWVFFFCTCTCDNLGPRSYLCKVEQLVICFEWQVSCI